MYVLPCLVLSFFGTTWLTDGTDIILSLVRTTRPGYLRDLRRLTVALSRARLGLYILGRREVFESCPELREVFAPLFAKGDKLSLVTGEMFPTERLVKQGEEVADVVEMEGVEHLGAYVAEMAKARIEDIKNGRQALPALADQSAAGGDIDDEDEGVGLVEGEVDEAMEDLA